MHRKLPNLWLNFRFGEKQQKVDDKNIFDVRKELIETYKADRKSYYLDDSVKTKRGEESGTPHRGLEAFIEMNLNFEIAESILDYTRYLIILDKKKWQLEHDAKVRGIA